MNKLRDLRILGLCFVAFAVTFGVKAYSSRSSVSHQNALRRAQIEASVKAEIGECALGDLMSRRDCYSQRLKNMRNVSNPPLKFVYEFEGKITPTHSDDLGDVASIKRVESRSMASCAANLFFFDWSSTEILVSLENPQALVICDGGKSIYHAAGLSSADVKRLVLEMKSRIPTL